MSEDAAFKRIRAARTARRFPAIFAAVADGRLHLSAVVMLAPHLTEDTVDELLTAAIHKSKSEIEELLAETPDPAPSVETQAWWTERDAALAAAVRELPPEQRRVIVLAYFGGLSQSDIAAVTATPLGTVKKRTRLALQKLRRAIEAHGSERASAV